MRDRQALWLARHDVELRLALRTTIAGLLAFALAELIGLAQGYWAVFTAVIVVQPSLGRSLKASLDRLMGTLGGAVFGAAVALALPQGDALRLGLALAVALAPLALLAALDQRFRVAPVTAIIVLLGGATPMASPVASAAGRILEIGLGCVIGFVVSLLVLPMRAHGLFGKGAGRFCALCAELVPALFARLAGAAEAPRLRPLNDRLRAVMTQLEASARETARERRSGLSREPDPAALLQVLRRLRGDLATIARLGGDALPASLAPSLDRLATAIADHFRACAAACAGEGAPPDIDAVADAFARNDAALAALRRELPEGASEPVLALGFALAPLSRDLADLTERVRAFSSDRPQ